MPSSLSPEKYAREFRSRMGFNSQTDAKEFLSAKNILPAVDLAYVAQLNGRIGEIVTKLDAVTHGSVRCGSLPAFLEAHLTTPFHAIRSNGLLPQLNNQGRRPEQVLFSWLRGHVMAQYFVPSLARLLGVEVSAVNSVGDDDFRSRETFARTPKADFQVNLNGCGVRVEIQSGFQGINDVKQHKWNEARRLFGESGTPTLCMHADIYNGQVAMIRLDTLAEGDQHWITRQQMEGQTVFNIDQNSFCWRITEAPLSLADFDITL